jgi:mitotic spindle assembly checkpoint protein MAD2
MATTKQAAVRQSITLKGSTDLVTEFFKFAVNTYVVSAAYVHPVSGSLNRNLHSILFQRGVYPADDFHMVKKYGQTVLITQDLALENYLEKYSSFRLLPACYSHTVSRILKQINSKRVVPP